MTGITMKENKKKQRPDNNFEAPNLHLSWIAGTFIAPLLTFVLSYFLNADNVSVSTLVIISLVILVVLLIVVCFSYALQLYNEAYNRQVVKFKLEMLENEVGELKEFSMSQNQSKSNGD